MKHPIFKYLEKNNELKKATQTNIDDNKFWKLKDDNQRRISAIVGEAISLIKKNEHNHILVDSEVWDSDVSANTIKKIGFENFRLPFDTFSVEMNGSLFLFNKLFKCHSHINENGIAQRYTSKIYESISFIKIEKYTSFSIPIFIKKENFELCIDEIGVDLFSALLYITTFKNDTRRVLKPTIYTSKKSGKLPKHKFRVIKLHQPINNKQGYSVERQQSEFAWIVRGYWRQQPYINGTIKPKWIDSYWKGKGKEKIEKVYKV